ncbi:hypothetical protein [Psychromicrobium xiongbiense]|uniref:hypothetical protein n=1 Tax=Psychromicrobium xiongbiense TaxID=3051184 RepID=UPI0025578D9D|nr:hypothetical protein [Psychromicrobium sp. YIM S02556]
MSLHRTPTPTSAFPPIRHKLPWPPSGAWKSIAAHLIIPLFLGLGMAVFYLGAFHEPTPHNLPVAIVGQSPAVKVLAQTMNDSAPGKLQVTTVATAAEAQQQLLHHEIAAAYDTDATHATIYVSKAYSDAESSAAQEVFLPLAYQQKLPVTVSDVRPGGEHDPTAQGLFFLLVALSVGSYASAVAVAASTAKLAIGWRMLVSAVVSLVVSGIGVIVAGPIYQVLAGNEWSIWLTASLYSFGIITIGVGLHPFLGKWTTPTLTLLFVMLNFTSSGGIFPTTLSPAFFSGLNTFWNGAAWLDAARALTYFPGDQFGWDGLRLALWATAGLGLIAVGHLASVRRRRLADDTIAATSEEEASVVAA